MTILFMLLAVAYLSGVANLLEIGENARIRFEIEPFSWLLAIIALGSTRKDAPKCDSARD